MPTDKEAEALAQALFEERARPGTSEELADRLLKDAKPLKNPAGNPRKNPEMKGAMGPRREKWIHPSGMVCHIPIQTNSGTEPTDYDPGFRMFQHQRFRRYGGMPYDEVPAGAPPSQWPAVRDLVIQKLRRRHEAASSTRRQPTEAELEEARKGFLPSPELSAAQKADARRAK